MIPEAAVEAAVQRSWHLEIATSDVRAILEAAAPHMLREAKAEAWEEGFAADDFEVSLRLDYNPYRPTP